MTKLLGAIALILICVGLLGYFMGWFNFSSSSTDQKSTISVTVDKEKVKQSEEKAKESLHSAEQKIKEEVKGFQKK
jgi:hypothetical protein